MMKTKIKLSALRNIIRGVIAEAREAPVYDDPESIMAALRWELVTTSLNMHRLTTDDDYDLQAMRTMLEKMHDLIDQIEENGHA